MKVIEKTTNTKKNVKTSSQRRGMEKDIYSTTYEQTESITDTFRKVR